jgi:hypothetical protein
MYVKLKFKNLITFSKINPKKGPDGFISNWDTNLISPITDHGRTTNKKDACW